MGRLEGRSALITGAANGIGRASALLFAREGAAVMCVDKSETVEETAMAILETGGRAIALSGDAADEGFLAAAVDRATANFGALDIFFANAGITHQSMPTPQMTAELWTEVFRVNVVGTFLGIKHASQAMIPRGKGSIVCTASALSFRAGPAPTAYSASKAAVLNLVQASANEFYGTGVRVNAVCPGVIRTNMTRHIYEKAQAEGKESPIGVLVASARDGYAEEVAHAALFLASDEASYVNGAGLAVDGGFSSTLPRPPRPAA